MCRAFGTVTNDAHFFYHVGHKGFTKGAKEESKLKTPNSKLASLYALCETSESFVVNFGRPHRLDQTIVAHPADPSLSLMRFLAVLNQKTAFESEPPYFSPLRPSRAYKLKNHNQ
jgi:hypothetical protein